MVTLFQNLIFLSVLTLFTACAVSKHANPSPDVLLKTDIQFSNFSKVQGTKAAFLQYIDDEAVLLKPGQYPIVGAAAKQFYEKQPPDITVHLTWAPQAASMASSGDLGYTYGIWTLSATDTTLQGTYVTIWKKQKDGSWKFVLDTGNSGLGKK